MCPLGKVTESKRTVCIMRIKTSFRSKKEEILKNKEGFKL
jgi:hypothetical protein